MPKVEIFYSTKVDQGLDAMLRPDPEYPVPKKLTGGKGVHMDFGRGGLYFWACAEADVAFTGVMHMGTGAMYIRPLVAEREGNASYGGPNLTYGKEVLQPISHNAKASLLENTFWERLPSRSGHNQLGQSAAWDSIINKFKGDSLKSRCQGFGSADLFNYEDRYLGFSVTKTRGTASDPYQLRLRSGTFNGKFTNKRFGPGKGLGITMPEDWAAVVKAGLEKNLS